MAKATLLLFLLTFFAKSSDAVDSDCNYYQELTPATTYYVYNNEFPYSYRGPKSCMWTLKSDYRVHLNCSTFQLPWSYDCSQDKLAIQISPNTTHQYCGNGTFGIESEGNTMTISLTAPFWSTGGRYLCEALAIKRPQDKEDCRCGWKNPTRIVGGTDTGVNEFPMMAGIVDFLLRELYCGGTIISSRYVVTAAHCVTRKVAKYLGILVGDHDLSTNAETNVTMLHRVNQIRIHPNYVEEENLNDIALMKTTEDMKFSNEVGPACLPFQHSPDTFGGSHVVLLGWGSTEFGGPPSRVLQKVSLSVLTQLECSKYYQGINSNQICTYAEGKDSCQMDSGGPVLWQNPTSRRLLLIGIISFGDVCAVSGGVNTRVGAYVDWIVSVTSDAAYCIAE